MKSLLFASTVIILTVASSNFGCLADNQGGAASSATMSAGSSRSAAGIQAVQCGFCNFNDGMYHVGVCNSDGSLTHRYDCDATCTNCMNSKTVKVGRVWLPEVGDSPNLMKFLGVESCRPVTVTRYEKKNGTQACGGKLDARNAFASGMCMGDAMKYSCDSTTNSPSQEMCSLGNGCSLSCEKTPMENGACNAGKKEFDDDTIISCSSPSSTSGESPKCFKLDTVPGDRYTLECNVCMYHKGPGYHKAECSESSPDVTHKYWCDSDCNNCKGSSSAPPNGIIQTGDLEENSTMTNEGITPCKPITFAEFSSSGCQAENKTGSMPAAQNTCIGGKTRFNCAGHGKINLTSCADDSGCQTNCYTRTVESDQCIPIGSDGQSMMLTCPQVSTTQVRYCARLRMNKPQPKYIASGNNQKVVCGMCTKGENDWSWSQAQCGDNGVIWRSLCSKGCDKCMREVKIAAGKVLPPGQEKNDQAMKWDGKFDNDCTAVMYTKFYNSNCNMSGNIEEHTLVPTDFCAGQNVYARCNQKAVNVTMCDKDSSKNCMGTGCKTETMSPGKCLPDDKYPAWMSQQMQCINNKKCFTMWGLMDADEYYKQNPKPTPVPTPPPVISKAGIQCGFCMYHKTEGYHKANCNADGSLTHVYHCDSNCANCKNTETFQKGDRLTSSDPNPSSANYYQGTYTCDAAIMHSYSGEGKDSCTSSSAQLEEQIAIATAECNFGSMRVHCGNDAASNLTVSGCNEGTSCSAGCNTMSVAPNTCVPGGTDRWSKYSCGQQDTQCINMQIKTVQPNPKTNPWADMSFLCDQCSIDESNRGYWNLRCNGDGSLTYWSNCTKGCKDCKNWKVVTQPGKMFTSQNGYTVKYLGQSQCTGVRRTVYKGTACDQDDVVSAMYYASNTCQNGETQFTCPTKTTVAAGASNKNMMLRNCKNDEGKCSDQTGMCTDYNISQGSCLPAGEGQMASYQCVDWEDKCVDLAMVAGPEDGGNTPSSPPTGSWTPTSLGADNRMSIVCNQCMLHNSTGYHIMACDGDATKNWRVQHKWQCDSKCGNCKMSQYILKSKSFMMNQGQQDEETVTIMDISKCDGGVMNYQWSGSNCKNGPKNTVTEITAFALGRCQSGRTAIRCMNNSKIALQYCEGGESCTSQCQNFNTMEGQCQNDSNNNDSQDWSCLQGPQSCVTIQVDRTNPEPTPQPSGSNNNGGDGKSDQNDVYDIVCDFCMYHDDDMGFHKVKCNKDDGSLTHWTDCDSKCTNCKKSENAPKGGTFPAGTNNERMRNEGQFDCWGTRLDKKTDDCSGLKESMGLAQSMCHDGTNQIRCGMNNTMWAVECPSGAQCRSDKCKKYQYTAPTTCSTSDENSRTSWSCLGKQRCTRVRPIPAPKIESNVVQCGLAKCGNSGDDTVGQVSMTCGKNGVWIRAGCDKTSAGFCTECKMGSKYVAYGEYFSYSDRLMVVNKPSEQCMTSNGQVTCAEVSSVKNNAGTQKEGNMLPKSFDIVCGVCMYHDGGYHIARCNATIGVMKHETGCNSDCTQCENAQIAKVGQNFAVGGESYRNDGMRSCQGLMITKFETPEDATVSGCSGKVSESMGIAAGTCTEGKVLIDCDGKSAVPEVTVCPGGAMCTRNCTKTSGTKFNTCNRNDDGRYERISCMTAGKKTCVRVSQAVTATSSSTTQCTAAVVAAIAPSVDISSSQEGWLDQDRFGRFTASIDFRSKCATDSMKKGITLKWTVMEGSSRKMITLPSSVATVGQALMFNVSSDLFPENTNATFVVLLQVKFNGGSYYASKTFRVKALQPVIKAVGGQKLTVSSNQPTTLSVRVFDPRGLKKDAMTWSCVSCEAPVESLKDFLATTTAWAIVPKGLNAGSYKFRATYNARVSVDFWVTVTAAEKLRVFAFGPAGTVTASQWVSVYCAAKFPSGSELQSVAWMVNGATVEGDKQAIRIPGSAFKAGEENTVQCTITSTAGVSGVGSTTVSPQKPLSGSCTISATSGENFGQARSDELTISSVWSSSSDEQRYRFGMMSQNKKRYATTFSIAKPGMSFTAPFIPGNPESQVVTFFAETVVKGAATGMTSCTFNITKAVTTAVISAEETSIDSAVAVGDVEQTLASAETLSVAATDETEQSVNATQIAVKIVSSVKKLIANAVVRKALTVEQRKAALAAISSIIRKIKEAKSGNSDKNCDEESSSTSAECKAEEEEIDGPVVSIVSDMIDDAKSSADGSNTGAAEDAEEDSEKLDAQETAEMLANVKQTTSSASVVNKLARHVGRDVAIGFSKKVATSTFVLVGKKQSPTSLPNTEVESNETSVKLPSDFAVAGATASSEISVSLAEYKKNVYGKPQNSETASRVVEVSVEMDGAISAVKDLTNPIAIKMIKSATATITFTNPKYICKYLVAGTTTGTWSTEGLTTNVTGQGEFTCLTTHLSTFGGFAEPTPADTTPQPPSGPNAGTPSPPAGNNPTTASTPTPNSGNGGNAAGTGATTSGIAGPTIMYIVVGSVLGICIIGLIAFFALRNKNNSGTGSAVSQDNELQARLTMDALPANSSGDVQVTPSHQVHRRNEFDL